MRNFGTKLGKNYAWELEFLRKHRDFKEGLTAFTFNIQGDWYPCDHKPSFEMTLVILNLTVFQLTVYNIWHEDNPNSPYFLESCGHKIFDNLFGGKNDKLRLND